MLELDADQWMRPRNETLDQSQQQMKQFLQWWIPYDWTQQVRLLLILLLLFPFFLLHLTYSY